MVINMRTFLLYGNLFNCKLLADPMGLDIDAELKDIQLYVGPNEICGE